MERPGVAEIFCLVLPAGETETDGARNQKRKNKPIMADLVSTPLLTATAAGGLTVVGIATGLNPALLFAGSCGAWWALSRVEPKPILARFNFVALSAVLAAWMSPVVVSQLCERGVIAERHEDMWQYPTAAIIGLLALPVIGSLLMDAGQASKRLVRRWIDKQGGEQK